MRRARVWSLGLLCSGVAAWLLAPAGCASDPHAGYSFASTFPTDVKTVSVPIFENYTDDPGLEAEVTEAVIKELQRSSGIRVVQGGAADSTIRGVVTGSELRRLSLQAKTGLVQEVGLTLTIDFDWVDSRSGKVLVSRKSFAAADTFVPAHPTGERIETGRHGAAQRLARDLVQELRSAW